VNKKHLTVFALALAPILTAATLQKRASKEERSFEGIVESIQKNWRAENYGLVVRDLKEGLGIASLKIQEQIRSVFKAPTGYTLVPDKNAQQAAANNPFLAAMSAGVGDMVMAEFKADEGRGRLTVNVTANSPLVSMFNMWLTNPAMLGDGELIEYENGHTGVLRKEGNGRSCTLQVLVNKQHVVDANLQNDERGEKVLFEALDQSFVDELARILGK